MKELDRWLEGRRPAPPEELRSAVAEALSRREVRSASTVDALVVTARLCLDEARDRPGRVRASAFALLLADGLLTYACEAALDTADPDASLLAMAEVAAGP